MAKVRRLHDCEQLDHLGKVLVDLALQPQPQVSIAWFARNGAAYHACESRLSPDCVCQPDTACRTRNSWLWKEYKLEQKGEYDRSSRENCKLQDHERLFHLGKALVHLGKAIVYLSKAIIYLSKAPVHLGLQLRTRLPYIRLRDETLRLRNLGSRRFGLVLWNVR